MAADQAAVAAVAVAVVRQRAGGVERRAHQRVGTGERFPGPVGEKVSVGRRLPGYRLILSGAATDHDHGVGQ